MILHPTYHPAPVVYTYASYGTSPYLTTQPIQTLPLEKEDYSNIYANDQWKNGNQQLPPIENNMTSNTTRNALIIGFAMLVVIIGVILFAFLHNINTRY